MPAIEVGREIRPRHEMKVEELDHQAAPPRNRVTYSTKGSVCSSGTRWPHCGMVYSVAPGISRAYASPYAGGKKVSPAPHSTRVGAVTRRRRRSSFGLYR